MWGYKRKDSRIGPDGSAYGAAGINPSTLAKVYRDLEVMGLLYTRRGMGVFINKDIETKCGQDYRKRIIGRLYEVISEAKAAGMSRKEVLTIAEASIAVDATPYGKLLSVAMGRHTNGRQPERLVSSSYRPKEWSAEVFDGGDVKWLCKRSIERIREQWHSHKRHVRGAFNGERKRQITADSGKFLGMRQPS